MNKIAKIKFVKALAKCSTVEAEIALDNNRWDVDAAVLEIFEGV